MGDLLEGKNKPKLTQICNFGFFINGIIVWIAFRALLPSHLWKREILLPFDDLQGLSNSDYFLKSGMLDFELSSQPSRGPGSEAGQVKNRFS